MAPQNNNKENIFTAVFLTVGLVLFFGVLLLGHGNNAVMSSREDIIIDTGQIPQAAVNTDISDGKETQVDAEPADISAVVSMSGEGPAEENPSDPESDGEEVQAAELSSVTTRFRSVEPSVGAPRVSSSTQSAATSNVKLPYQIYVSKESFTIAILGLDDDGEYTKLLHTFHTAIGRTNAMTRTGTYKITSRERWHHWGGASYSPYATKHSGGLWFHGPVFEAKDSYTLMPHSYNDIGTNATSGCLRTYTSAAAWIYYNCQNGTQVIIANDSKYTSSPRAQIDSGQNFDPTDPDIRAEDREPPPPEQNPEPAPGGILNTLPEPPAEFVPITPPEPAPIPVIEP